MIGSNTVIAGINMAVALGSIVLFGGLIREKVRPVRPRPVVAPRAGASVREAR